MRVPFSLVFPLLREVVWQGEGRVRSSLPEVIVVDVPGAARIPDVGR